MSRLTKKIFAAGMTALADRFNKELSPLVQGIYGEVLADLTGEEFEAGVKRAVAECEFYPTAKQIYDFARPALPLAIEAGHVFALFTGDDEVRSYHPAVGTVYDLARIRERYGDAAALAFVSIGGGNRLRATPDEKMEWVRKEFREAYEGFMREAQSRATLERLGVPTAPALTRGRYGDAPRRLAAAPTQVGDVLAGQDRAAGSDR